MQTKATVLIVPGLRGPSKDHWQTHLETRIYGSKTVPLLRADDLGCEARVDQLDKAIAAISGEIILVAHSGACLVVAHWANRYERLIKGALLVVPPDLYAEWPPTYPPSTVLRDAGWAPLPTERLRFPSIVVASGNDYLATPAATVALAERWGSRLYQAGLVGHLNPAAGYGLWAQAEPLIAELDR